MKSTAKTKMLASLALLGLPFSTLADEKSNTKPTATVIIAKPVTDAKAPEQPKPAEVKSTPKATVKPSKPETAKPPPAADAPNVHGARLRKGETQCEPWCGGELPIVHVRKGETLSGIALRHGLTSKRLALWNHLSDPDRLSIGQHLEIPPRTTPRTPKSLKAAKVPPVTSKPTSTAGSDEVRVTLSSK